MNYVGEDGSVIVNADTSEGYVDCWAIIAIRNWDLKQCWEIIMRESFRWLEGDFRDYDEPSIFPWGFPMECSTDELIEFCEAFAKKYNIDGELYNKYKEKGGYW